MVETFGRERRENLGVDRGLRWKKVLQTRKSMVLGLQENQRVAQDCNRILSTPYSRRNLRLSGDTLVADGIAGQFPVIRRGMIFPRSVVKSRNVWGSLYSIFRFESVQNRQNFLR